MRGGANVYPAEVERVIRLHPAVTEAAVFGVPDERLGEKVAALVQLGTEIATGYLEELCRQHLARYKIPVTWSVVDSFPKNAMGKIIRTRLPGPPRHPGQHRCPGLLPQRDHGQPLPRERSLTWLRRNTRLPRCGAPEDFTGAVLWLASDASQYVAGQTIVIIDGGWTAR